MAQDSSTQDRGLEFIRHKKVVTLYELTLHLHCSARTVQRWLAKWQAISSYNRNGSCYSLPDIAAFDADGLWRYRGIFFSQFGTLSATFVQLAANARAGLTAAEAGELLGVRASSFLWSLPIIRSLSGKSTRDFMYISARKRRSARSNGSSGV